MLQTERLDLIPLTERQLELLVYDIATLEKELNCYYRAEPIKGFFREIVKGQLEITKGDPSNFEWHSFWLIIRRSDRIVVGSADFKDLPSSAHEVEIGYGLGKAFEHCGYMTETVEAMCRWAMSREGVAHVIAETDTDGIASQKILQRCGFSEYSKGDTSWWRL